MGGIQDKVAHQYNPQPKTLKLNTNHYAYPRQIRLSDFSILSLKVPTYTDNMAVQSLLFFFLARGLAYNIHYIIVFYKPFGHASKAMQGIIV